MSNDPSLVGDIAFEPGASEARPHPHRRRRAPHVRWPGRRRRRAPRGAAQHHHRADRPERRRQDHVLQPAHRLRRADTGTWSFDGHPMNDVAPHRTAKLGMVRTFQLTKSLTRHVGDREHAARRLRAEGRAVLGGAVPVRCGRTRRRRTQCAPRRCSTRFKLDHMRDEYAGLAVGRPAQAARDGPGADGRAVADHARRADGRREPGAEAEPARPHPQPEGRGAHRAVRRARHGHGARDQRLGHRHGRGSDHRRGPAGGDRCQPGRHRRVPRRPPEHRPRDCVHDATTRREPTHRPTASPTTSSTSPTSSPGTPPTSTSSTAATCTSRPASSSASSARTAPASRRC